MKGMSLKRTLDGNANTMRLVQSAEICPLSRAKGKNLSIGIISIEHLPAIKESLGKMAR